MGTEKHKHASGEWVTRNPSEVTEWFEKAVEEKSPKVDLWGKAPKVRLLRRIVRLVKWFCRSRQSWSLPDELITTTLVVECSRPDANRDDVALYNTLEAIQVRLSISCSVWQPSGGGRQLTKNSEHLHQVKSLTSKLAQEMPRLAILTDNARCTRDKALKQWKQVFQHTYWSDGEAIDEEAAVAKATWQRPTA